MRTLIENLEFILTVDRDDRVMDRASVVVENDRIADVGAAAEVAKRHPRASFDKVIDGSRYGMTPGFIDSHVHLSETLSRAVFPDNLATRAWVFHWAKPFYATVDGRDEVVGATIGIAEMLRCGTTPRRFWAPMSLKSCGWRASSWCWNPPKAPTRRLRNWAMCCG